MRRLLALMLGVVSLAAAGDESIGTTGSLLGFCESDDSGLNLACIFYISGFMEAHTMGKDQFFCLPPGVTGGQGVAVFSTWAQAHPEWWHLGRGSGVAIALRESFPCVESDSNQ